MQLKGRVYNEMPTSEYEHMSKFWQGKLENYHMIMSINFNCLN